ncbi:hypothetical protein NBRC116590_17250 [Pelagimonas sp. KU-00592-HH]|uniref:hypothetical protein n=1 Tax=Pelagimonas sp. KU-00592-HH TaxID=3127651 RepID=UPI003102CC52
MKVNANETLLLGMVVTWLFTPFAYADIKALRNGALQAEFSIQPGTAPASVYSELVMGPGVPVTNRLVVVDTSLQQHVVQLDPLQLVFEGPHPLLADLSGDGFNEVIVVETDKELGASLAVYGVSNDALEKLAQTPFLGKRPQWLSFAGIADFDGDTINEIAIVEKPHGGNVVAILELKDNSLVRLAELKGPTNHVEGTDFFQSALRKCNGRVEILMSDHDWAETIAVWLWEGELKQRALGPFKSLDHLRKLSSRCD